jgi:hypothetical protein
MVAVGTTGIRPDAGVRSVGSSFRRIAVNGQPEFLVSISSSPAIKADCPLEVS